MACLVVHYTVLYFALHSTVFLLRCACFSNEASKKGAYQMAGKGNGGDHGEDGIL